MILSRSEAQRAGIPEAYVRYLCASPSQTAMLPKLCYTRLAFRANGLDQS